MRTIINVRINNDNIDLFELNTGEILSKNSLFLDMVLNNSEYQIFVNGTNHKIVFSQDGSTIKNPPLDIFREINNL